MDLINASDLTELANQVNEETVNSEIFLVQFCPHESEEFIKRYKGDDCRIFNQLSSRLITRCIMFYNLIMNNKQLNQVKNTYQSQSRDLTTILFPSSADISNIPFSAVKTQAKEIMKRVKLGAELGA